MTKYNAPTEDMQFVIRHLTSFGNVPGRGDEEEIGDDLLASILEEGGKFAGGVLAPLNRVGDNQGSHLNNGVVRTPDGWQDAYRQFVEGGWNAVPFDPDYGGQGLPQVVATSLQDMWHGANMAFALCPMLTQAAVEALSRYGTDAQKTLYLEKLVSGEWTGTMNLTEPQAGSDLARVRTKAIKEGDHYRISGQKIFITYGDHDLTDNIIHMVLARTPDAPEGVKGISLFIVPKILVNEDGSLGARNDVRCVSLEEKMGIHASPTAVMSYGDEDGAVGYLVGEENRGLAYMFTMMNNARLSVGLEGVGIAERAYQKAASFARERIQSRDIVDPSPDPVAIIHHPDVRRMLMTMRALAESGRALAYYTAGQIDLAHGGGDADQKRAAQARVDFMIPIVKGWCTEGGSEAAWNGVQVHGGMGYVEEAGAAQFMRDAKIAEIYEGTNGIQANDLVGRKVGRDGGEEARAFIAEMRQTAKEAMSSEGPAAQIGRRLEAALGHLSEATDWVVNHSTSDVRGVAASAMPYLRLWGVVAGGWMLLRACLSAQDAPVQSEHSSDFLANKVATSQFFSERILTRSTGYRDEVLAGAGSVLAISAEQL